MSEYVITRKTYADGLPDTVKVGPIEFQIEQVPCPTVPNPEGEDEEPISVYGKINFKRALITIDSELEASMKWQCFLHEVVHAILETVGMAGTDGGLEEGEVDALAYMLMSFLLDNGFLSKQYFPAPESNPAASTVFPYPYTLEKR
jgi:hypothetical protein